MRGRQTGSGNRMQIRAPYLDPVRVGETSGNLRCRCCGRPDGVVVRCLPDGRWYDGADETWRDGRGRRVPWPEATEYAATTDILVSVEALRITRSAVERVRLLCNRCRRLEGAVHGRARARISILLRRAIGDLFLGRYDDPAVLTALVDLYRKDG